MLQACVLARKADGESGEFPDGEEGAWAEPVEFIDGLASDGEDVGRGAKSPGEVFVNGLLVLEAGGGDHDGGDFAFAHGEGEGILGGGFGFLVAGVVEDDFVDDDAGWLDGLLVRVDVAHTCRGGGLTRSAWREGEGLVECDAIDGLGTGTGTGAEQGQEERGEFFVEHKVYVRCVK